jgi:hypothetical protein
MRVRLFASAVLPVLLLASPSRAQKAQNSAVQVDAMKKFGFLAGSWKGTGTIEMPDGKKSFSQNETVTFKLSGLVAVIDGLGTAPDGAVVHQALAILSFDPAKGKYRFSAYSGSGNVHDGDAVVGDTTFEWAMQHGPVSMRYAVHLDEKRRWVETGEVKRGESPWRRFFEMTLEKVP